MVGASTDPENRARPVRRAPAGYPHGPDAPQVALTLALDKVERAEAVIVVEGVSDQVAIETLAVRLGRNLDDEDIAVLPVGGAQAAAGHLRALGPEGSDLHLAGLFDADAVSTVLTAVAGSGLGRHATEEELAILGFHLCHRDLEDELLRAVGPDAALAMVEAQGELGSFRTFQKQPAWRGRPVLDQLRRFTQAKARRGQRYARLLVEQLEADGVPQPFQRVLNEL